VRLQISKSWSARFTLRAVSNVRYGSLADIFRFNCEVRFVP
jgi:hypothetical protein